MNEREESDEDRRRRQIQKDIKKRVEERFGESLDITTSEPGTDSEVDANAAVSGNPTQAEAHEASIRSGTLDYINRATQRMQLPPVKLTGQEPIEELEAIKQDLIAQWKNLIPTLAAKLGIEVVLRGDETTPELNKIKDELIAKWVEAGRPK